MPKVTAFSLPRLLSSIRYAFLVKTGLRAVTYRTRKEEREFNPPVASSAGRMDCHDGLQTIRAFRRSRTAAMTFPSKTGPDASVGLPV